MTVAPLEGIRVLNLGAVAAAPSACRILSDFGAEVIRAESMMRLDTIRLMQPMAEGLPPEESINCGGGFPSYNSGAKSFLANLKDTRGIELIKKLVGICDVVVENYSVGTMKDLGLDYDTLKAINPGIIMLSLSAVGQTGPYNDMMTYGPTVASASGEQSMLGYPDGEVAMDYGTADFLAATAAAYCIVIALMHREQTGKGQFIDVGQVEPTIYTLGEPLMDLIMNGRIPGKQGNRRPGIVPNSNYPCTGEQQWISISCETDEEWINLCDCMGNPEWAQKPEFATMDKRWENQEEIDQLIGEWTIGYDNLELTQKLQAAGVAAMAMLDEELILSNPHYKARDAIMWVDVYKAPEKVPYGSPPIRLSDYRCELGRPAPNMGEHTDYVYGDLLGLSKAEIEQLKQEKVIF